MENKKYNMGKMDIVILTLLRDNEELSAIEIQNLIKQKQKRTIALATIYYTLNRLEKYKYITISRHEKCGANRGGRPKTYFRLNNSGLIILNKHIEDLENIGLISPSLAITKIGQLLKIPLRKNGFIKLSF